MLVEGATLVSDSNLRNGSTAAQVPGRPILTACNAVTEGQEQGMHVFWEIPEGAVPPVVAIAVRLQATGGASEPMLVDGSTGTLVCGDGITCRAPQCQVFCSDVVAGVDYEATVCFFDGVAWSETSLPSKSACVGSQMQKPPAPAPPVLISLGGTRLKCTWVIPTSTPPVEVTSLQLTELDSGYSAFVDAETNALVPKGGAAFMVPDNQVTLEAVKADVRYVARLYARNAVGFSSGSPPSSPVRTWCVSGINRCLGGVDFTPAAPILQGAGAGKLRVKWELDDRAKCTTVKIRPVGDSAWQLLDSSTGNLVPRGGTTVMAPKSEAVAIGIIDGVEYEATVAFLISKSWSHDSPISAPYCFGSALPTCEPPTPLAPVLVPLMPNRMRVQWVIPQAVPPITVVTLKMRIVGERRWQYFNSAAGTLVERGGDAVCAPTTEIEVGGLHQNRLYEACVSMRNSRGWGDDSPPSEPVCIGEPQPLPPPSRPAKPFPPWVFSPAVGVLRVDWSPIASARPPVEQTAVQMKENGSSEWLNFNWRLANLDEFEGVPVAAPTCAIDVSELDSNQRYHARVAHCNAEGWSDYSEPSLFVWPNGETSVTPESGHRPVRSYSETTFLKEEGQWSFTRSVSAALRTCCALRQNEEPAVHPVIPQQFTPRTPLTPQQPHTPRTPLTPRTPRTPRGTLKPTRANSYAKRQTMPICVVCSEPHATMAIIPCGHKCLCESCLTTGGGYISACPICRGEIASINRIYG